MRWAWLILGAQLALGAFLIAFSHLHTSQGLRAHAALRELRAADSRVTEEVLKARYVLFMSYDDLVVELQRIRRLTRYLQEIPPGGEVPRLVEQLSKGLTDKADLAESIKGDNAVLRNSINYFPTLVAEVVDQCRREGHAEVCATLDDVGAGVLQYSLTPRAESSQNIYRQLDGLSQASRRLSPDLQQKIGFVREHASIILTRMQKVERSIQNLVDIPTRDACEALMVITEGANRQDTRLLYWLGMALCAACVLQAIVFTRS